MGLSSTSRTALRRRSFVPVRIPGCLPNTHQTVRPRTLNETGPIICLDTHILRGVYQESGVSVRSHCGTEPPCDIEPSGLVTTVGWRDRGPASHGAADRVQAPASASRGRFRGIHGGRSAPSLPAETGTTSGGRCLAGSVPPVLVRSRGCSRTPPRPNGAIHGNEKEDKEKNDAAQNANVTKEKTK